jgi:hypothetical protein
MRELQEWSLPTFQCSIIPVFQTPANSGQVQPSPPKPYDLPVRTLVNLGEVGALQTSPIFTYLHPTSAIFTKTHAQNGSMF